MPEAGLWYFSLRFDSRFLSPAFFLLLIIFWWNRADFLALRGNVTFFEDYFSWEGKMWWGVSMPISFFGRLFFFSLFRCSRFHFDAADDDVTWGCSRLLFSSDAEFSLSRRLRLFDDFYWLFLHLSGGVASRFLQRAAGEEAEWFLSSIGRFFFFDAFAAEISPRGLISVVFADDWLISIASMPLLPQGLLDDFSDCCEIFSHFSSPLDDFFDDYRPLRLWGRWLMLITFDYFRLPFILFFFLHCGISDKDISISISSSHYFM